MRIPAAECALGKCVLGNPYDLAGVAEHFTRLISLNRTVVADGPASLVRDASVLRATYNGHLIQLDRTGDALLLEDPHHREGAHYLMPDLLLHPIALGFMQRALVASVLVGGFTALVGAMSSRKGSPSSAMPFRMRRFRASSSHSC